MRKYTRPFQPQKNALAELLKEGKTVATAAASLRIPRSTAYDWLNELGLPKRKYNRRGI